MKPEEQVEGCIKLAEFWSTRYSARQQYEWRVTLGLWALLAAAAAFLADKEIGGKGWWAIAIIIGHALWLRGIWAANQDNRLPAYFWANQAAGLLRDPHHKIADPPGRLKGFKRWSGFIWDWSMVFQLLTTTALVILVYNLIGSKIAMIIE